MINLKKKRKIFQLTYSFFKRKKKNLNQIRIFFSFKEPPLVSCKLESTENNYELVVECFLDESKTEYLSALVLYLTNEEKKLIYNVTCSISTFQGCVLSSQKFYTIFKPKFPDLSPGTNYSFESMSYSFRIPNTQSNSARLKFQTGCLGNLK